MPGIDYHQLRQQIRMRQVLDLIGFQATWRRGPQLRGRAPSPAAAQLRTAPSPSISPGRSITASPAVLVAMRWIFGQPSMAYPSIKLLWISVASRTSIRPG